MQFIYSVAPHGCMHVVVFATRYFTTIHLKELHKVTKTATDLAGFNDY